MTMVQSLKATLSSRAAVLIYAASAVRFFGGYTIAAFMPLFFKVRFYKAATKPSPSSSQLHTTLLPAADVLPRLGRKLWPRQRPVRWHWRHHIFLRRWSAC